MRPESSGSSDPGSADARAAPPAPPASPPEAPRRRDSPRSLAGHVARGAAIGVVETVPGVSGGTIALVVGLYERLLAAGNHVVAAVLGLADVVRGRGASRSRAELRRVELPLLLAVGTGMVLAVVVASRVVPPLLDAFPEGSRAVFFGMVAASLAVPFGILGRPRPHEATLVVLAACATFALLSLSPPSGGGGVGTPPWWLVFGAAALAISALTLPGVSGSFLLLVMGLYEPTLDAVADGDVGYLLVFAAGAVTGLAAFVSVLTRLLTHHRRATMAVIGGLLLGALRALWPWQQPDGGLLAPGPDVGILVLLALAGAAVVGAVVFVEHRRERAAATS